MAGWWRVVRADQWGVFFIGAMLGMALPALLYVTFLPAGADIRGLGISAALANGIGLRAGPLVAGVVAFLGVWLLFKSQLDILEGTVRAVTDILWTGSRRLRERQGADVRSVYYSILAITVVWGVIALRLAQPIVLLQIGANVASVVFIIASLHLLYLNTRLFPKELHPPLWRRICLVSMAIFYSFFVTLSLSSSPLAASGSSDGEGVRRRRCSIVPVAGPVGSSSLCHSPGEAKKNGARQQLGLVMPISGSGYNHQLSLEAPHPLTSSRLHVT
ncbi:MAG: hypothetical protein H0U59_07815 [Gemmatimonadaceae bacterium]|nr:hypothetical protein [Gemmatimonadaceae bacterium]